MNRLRGPARRTYYRSRAARRLLAATRWARERSDRPDLAHLALFKETATGPVQRDEALLLHALVRVVCPETIVEVGFLHGHSAFNFLRAMDDGARLYSFDITPISERRAAELAAHDPRFAFRRRSQDELSPADIDGRRADLVFLDASHDLALNQATFERLLALMAPDALLAIHDTGTVPRRLVPEGHWWLMTSEGWIGDEREVLPDERAFVNWIREAHPEFSEVHLHSKRKLRCGITVLQRSAPLARSDDG